MPLQKVPLNQPWKLTHFPQATIGVDDVLAERQPLEWIDAEVPNNVVLDMYKAGKCPDPFMGLNPELIRPLEYHEWWYKTEFSIDETAPASGKVNLLFEGLDTFADVYIDGQLMGNFANALVPQRLELPGKLESQKKHQLHVRIKSDMYEVVDKDFEGVVDLVANDPSRAWIRKAGHAHGWNIFPRLLSAGLWGNVSLEYQRPYFIDDVFVFTKKFGTDASTIMARVFLKTPHAYKPDLQVRFQLLDGKHSVYSETYKMQFPMVFYNFTLENPKLWWPRPYGDQHLYNIHVEFLDKEGRLLDEWKGQFGVRSIEIVQEPLPEGHRSFYFKINDVPISVYGTNHVPLDNFPALSKPREAKFLELLDESNSNMIRVWGGGIYESSDFYAACDRMGVMIWHDFMFGCALYPQDSSFLEQVRVETRDVLRRLRNHPSIVLWCADNEIDLHLSHYFSAHQNGGNRAIAHELLPECIARYDGTRPYWPSSPYTPIPGEPAHSYKAGDTHIWCHGLYYKAPIYSEDLSPFISEIGHLALVNRESLQQFIPADKLWPYDREVWGYRCGSLSDPISYCYPDGRLVQNEDNVINVFGSIPDNLDDFIYASQIVQAEAYKTWIERARRRKFSCGGILWWNLLDGCPQISDAVVDYYYGKKIAFEAIRRVQDDILICAEKEQEQLNLYLVNDRLVKHRVKYEVELNGEVIREGDVIVPPNSSILLDQLESTGNAAAMFILRAQVENKAYINHYFDGVPPFDYEKISKLFKAIYDMDAQCITA
jgi:beta-mannosidase